MKLPQSFEEGGFLSRDAKLGIHNVCAEDRAWFQLAYDLNLVLMRTVDVGMKSARGLNWSREAVSVRLLMRTTGAFQGVVRLSQLGMVAPARTLVRTIIEHSFCAAAILDKFDEIIAMLRQDAEARRRMQASFITENELGGDPAKLARLKQVVDEMEKARRIDWKEVAKTSSLLPQYLNYLRLPDDSLHTSASSLDKHIARNVDGNGWTYKTGPGQPDDITATLHRAVLATMPVTIAVTQVVLDPLNNAALDPLSKRFQALPTGNTI